MATVDLGGVLVGDDTISRFWSHVKRGADNECWTWTGSMRGKGRMLYGRIKARGITMAAHRLSFAIAGGTFGPETVIMHTCDVPLCVNPAHLRAGTTSENVADRVQKGRSASGESSGKAKLDGATVKRIREMRAAGIRQQAIADAVGMSRAQVAKVAAGDAWASAEGPITKDRGVRGSEHHHAKLCESTVMMIKRRIADGETLSSIAEDVGVSRATISLIKSGKVWSHVEAA
jgi:hypothetical protein